VSDTTDLMGARVEETAAAPSTDASAPATGAGSRRRRGTGLEGMVLAELQQVASGLGIRGTARMRKSQLIEVIKEKQAGGSGAPALADVSVTRGSDVIVISSVELVARKLRLEQEDAACPAEELPDDEGGADDEDDSEECPTLKLGPLLLNPPLGPGAQTFFTADLPVGTYDEVNLQIHRPTDANGDAAFLAAHPDFQGVSIRVTGTFNGTPFTFTTGLTAEIEMELDTPIEVTTAGPTNITIFMDVTGWFVSESGEALLSPLALSTQGQTRVEQNIRRSFHAFEDEDEDGGEDPD
jgi:hypothetical protein